ncbi:hypothetical protein LTR62_000575 [Meristemomyces frigidus]|uniref:Nucleoporin protein Ndc1-Nup n=1 Tax=Meristemomyces frigidus TaxID=1508187 RepID=A0AAN7YMW0_9PEZI|nr:hypothetical protein LTR62_000575 [Meristemomyces frigidus]
MTTPASQPTATPPAIPTARPYKDFLTPLLHRRFTHAALLLLAQCYLYAIILSPSSSLLWRLLPIGLSGIRTLLIFMPALAVFIIRVMNMHIGRRTSTSPVETIVQRALDSRAWATAFWYIFSACFFGELYIWSRTKDADLGWIDYGRSYERPKVNENPVLLRSIYVMLAIAQTGLHLWRDYDRIEVEETEARESRQIEGAVVSGPMHLLVLQSQTILGRVLRLVMPGIVFCVPVYFLFVRQTMWNCLAYPIAKTMLGRHLPSNEGPTAISGAGKLLWQAVSSSAMLVVLWEFSNAVFGTYVAQLPLKRSETLTADIKDAAGRVISKSVDPNGSLIRGFKAKKDLPRSFALWELILIVTRYDARRQTIFAEVDRAGGSTWSQVSSYCLDEISAVSTRIRRSQEPLQAVQTSQPQQDQPQQQQQQYGLPKIAQQQVHNDGQVVQQRIGKVDAMQTVGNFAKIVGQQQHGQTSSVLHYGQLAIEYGLNKTNARQALSNNGIQSKLQEYGLQFLQTPVGEPLRRTFANQVEAVVLGVPYSNGINIIHASRALVQLAVRSFQEDRYGQVSPSIPNIIRTYTDVLSSITRFIASLPPHWTDVAFTDGQRDLDRNEGLREVKDVADVLREGLEEVVLAFGEYADNIGLSRVEMRLAREAIGKCGGRGMVQR